MRRIISTILFITAMAATISAQPLTSRQKHLATIAALEAQGNLTRLEPAIIDALDGGVTINEIKEAFSQLYAYTGFPRSLNALSGSAYNRDEALNTRITTLSSSTKAGAVNMGNSQQVVNELCVFLSERSAQRQPVSRAIPAHTNYLW